MARLGLMLVLVLTTSSMTWPPAPPMFPAFTIFRGGNLADPVLLSHSNVKTVTVNGRGIASLDHDPLAIIYQTLVSTNLVPPDAPDIVATFDVAEFFGPEWMAPAGPDGKPTRKLRLEEASHFSHLYAMRAGPPIWMNPVVASGGGSYSLMILSDTAQAILKGLGLQFR